MSFWYQTKSTITDRSVTTRLLSPETKTQSHVIARRTVHTCLSIDYNLQRALKSIHVGRIVEITPGSYAIKINKFEDLTNFLVLPHYRQTTC